MLLMRTAQWKNERRKTESSDKFGIAMKLEETKLHKEHAITKNWGISYILGIQFEFGSILLMCSVG